MTPNLADAPIENREELDEQILKRIKAQNRRNANSKNKNYIPVALEKGYLVKVFFPGRTKKKHTTVRKEEMSRVSEIQEDRTRVKVVWLDKNFISVGVESDWIQTVYLKILSGLDHGNDEEVTAIDRSGHSKMLGTMMSPPRPTARIGQPVMPDTAVFLPCHENTVTAPCSQNSL